MLKNHKNKIYIGIIVLLVIALVLIIIVAPFKTTDTQDDKSGYSVVYLSTGQIYIGELNVFPIMKLKNSYILTTGQDNTDPQKTNLQLSPVNEILWAPKYLYLNRDEIVFYGPILKNSKVGQALASKLK